MNDLAAALMVAIRVHAGQVGQQRYVSEWQPVEDPS
jgi:hypothetical protein